MQNIIEIIKTKIDLNEKSIKNIIRLLEDGCTIAFIARYRKDMTSNVSDETLLKFQKIYEYSLKLTKRKEEILNILKEKEVLNSKLQELIENATVLRTLEDIYKPYKGTKSTRADDAIRNNLEGLANIISCMRYSKDEINHKSKAFLNDNVKNIDDVINGATDIIALRYAQDIKTKETLRRNLENYGVLVTKKTKTFEENGLYKDLANITQNVGYIKSHRLLAIFRAVNEKQLSVKIDSDEEYLINGIKKFRIPHDANSSKEYVFSACVDGLKRLLLPSLKRELLSNLKQKASDEAINLFGGNLHELLITPPLVNHSALGNINMM